MLTPDQIQRRALNRYPDFLRSLCTGEAFFPLAVFGAGLAKPKDFVTDRAAIETLHKRSKEQAGFGYEITWEERNFRRLGTQNIPSAVTFPTQDDYIRFLKKQTEVCQFQADYDLIERHCPELGAWAQAKPLKVVSHAGIWSGLLNVCVYLRTHPRPNCYLRELPVAVDTKFIENHKGILAELLPIAAPLTAGPDDSRFETRFGFRFKQPLVRMRFLDEKLVANFGVIANDFATPLNQFVHLQFGGKTILIVENEMTFLTLPSLPETIAIWGAGDAAVLLSKTAWLHSCRVFYWGDLDSHGFETLSCLREKFSNIVSVLMDESTLATYFKFSVKAATTRIKGDLLLTCEEKSLYNRLATEELLLEQEHIPVEFSNTQLLHAIALRNGS